MVSKPEDLYVYLSCGALIVSGQMRSQSRDLKMQLKSLGYHTLKEWDHDMTGFTIPAEKN